MEKETENKRGDVMEIINRKMKIEKEDLADKEIQFSLNNWGHFAIRIFDPDNDKEDKLIVLSKSATQKLISFCKDIPIYI